MSAFNEQPMYFDPQSQLDFAQMWPNLQVPPGYALEPIYEQASELGEPLIYLREPQPRGHVQRQPKLPMHENSVCSHCGTGETTLWRRN